MNYSQEELDKLHKIEIEILSEVIRVCEKNNIKWFSVGGTTLGAVRHNGFIPWDDDIDIGMLRDDYERFLEIAPKELNKGYTLQHFIYDKNSPTYFAKVRKDNTRFVEKHCVGLNIHLGVFIDIMPYDTIPNSKFKCWVYSKFIYILHNLYVSKLCKKPTFSKKKWILIFGGIVRPIINFILRPISRKRLFRLLDRTMRQYNGLNNDELSSRGDNRFKCSISDIFPVSKHQFENIKINIPNNYNYILTRQYGNYLSLPSEKERYTHKPVELYLD